ncbi:MAG: radical SAM protein [Candidatus Aenigmarchaeota archaeon]|nr:radical SAM protein [Candidatus Aenigmarchaeota archaeon]
MVRNFMVTVYPQAAEKSIEEWRDAPTSPFVKDFTLERKEKLVKILPKTAKILKFHASLCPGCVDESKFSKMKIDAVTYEKDGKVWQIKQCAEHGITKELSYGDYEMYKKYERFQDPGIQMENPIIDKSKLNINCPEDCGLCAEHESHTALGNIVVTNRCDISCWYCFFYAKEGEPIYEPTMEQMKLMLSRMRNEKPVGANSVQLTGGEPTLREDLADIVKIATEMGYEHVQLNTNGINLSRDPQLAAKLKEAGVSNLYMSFDGVTPQTNPKNFWEAPKAIENCSKAGIGVVLVPTVIGGINDHELGDIIRFASGHINAVRAVNFQPVSLVGRMPHAMRKKQRVTIPGVIKRVEQQTDGEIGRENWFTIPCAKSVTNFIEVLKNTKTYRLSNHFQCGAATYVFKDENGKLVPLPEFFDVSGFFEYVDHITDDITKSKHKAVTKTWALAKLPFAIKKFIDNEKKPKYLKFGKMLFNILSGSNYDDMAEFHLKSLFLGIMHFQDPNNWDIDRIHKCNIHYAVPDGRILPFCTFNVIPELYRDRVQRKFAIPAKEWEQKTGKSLKDSIYHRSFTKEEQEKLVTYYDQYRKTKDRPIIESEWGDEDEGTDFVPISKFGRK